MGCECAVFLRNCMCIFLWVLFIKGLIHVLFAHLFVPRTMSDVKKRGWDDAAGSEPQQQEEQSPAKKPKTNGGASATNGSAAGGPPKPAVSLDVLEKAKKALQLQKQLQEKLKKLPVCRAMRLPLV